MEWTGLVGAATYAGDLAPFWPYLVFGQWAHVGKGTTFGLGSYRIEPLDAVAIPTEG
jgi:CRISPR/Cas system endoribonuclease Cas6 (RAMP superfamily)